jgi:hypothetical protein
VHEFLDHAFSLVDASVASYRQRGFSNLMVSFGCTGGQHRSVYLAEQLAEHLRGTKAWRSVRHIELEKLGHVRRIRNEGDGSSPPVWARACARSPTTVPRRWSPLPAARCLRSPSRLRTFGVREVIVNVHHFADSIVDYLAANQNFRHEDRNLARGGPARHRRRPQEGRMVLS